MRYWIYWNELVQGPFEVDELVCLKAFSPELLVCEETKQEWIPAHAASGLWPHLAPRMYPGGSANAPPPPPERPPALEPLQGEMFTDPPAQQKLFDPNAKGEDPGSGGSFAFRPSTEAAPYYLEPDTLPPAFTAPFHFVVILPEAKPAPESAREAPTQTIEKPPEKMKETPVVGSFPPVTSPPPVKSMPRPLPLRRKPSPELSVTPAAPVTRPLWEEERRTSWLPLLGGSILFMGLLCGLSYFLMQHHGSRAAITEAVPAGSVSPAMPAPAVPLAPGGATPLSGTALPSGVPVSVPPPSRPQSVSSASNPMAVPGAPPSGAVSETPSGLPVVPQPSPGMSASQANWTLGARAARRTGPGIAATSGTGVAPKGLATEQVQLGNPSATQVPVQAAPPMSRAKGGVLTAVSQLKNWVLGFFIKSPPVAVVPVAGTAGVVGSSGVSSVLSAAKGAAATSNTGVVSGTPPLAAVSAAKASLQVLQPGSGGAAISAQMQMQQNIASASAGMERAGATGSLGKAERPLLGPPALSVGPSQGLPETNASHGNWTPGMHAAHIAGPAAGVLSNGSWSELPQLGNPPAAPTQIKAAAFIFSAKEKVMAIISQVKNWILGFFVKSPPAAVMPTAGAAGVSGSLAVPGISSAARGVVTRPISAPSGVAAEGASPRVRAAPQMIRQRNIPGKKMPSRVATKAPTSGHQRVAQARANGNESAALPLSPPESNASAASTPVAQELQQQGEKAAAVNPAPMAAVGNVASEPKPATVAAPEALSIGKALPRVPQAKPQVAPPGKPAPLVPIDPWKGKENDAIALTLHKKIYGGKRTIESNAQLILEELHEKELLHAADTGERLYLPDKINWSAIHQDEAIYRVYLNFSALQANGERDLTRSDQFLVSLQLNGVTPVDENTRNDFFNDATMLIHHHSKEADDIEGLLSAVDQLNKQKMRAIIVKKNRHNKEELKEIEKALTIAQEKLRKAVVYFRTQYPEKALQNVARAYDFVPLLKGF